MVTIVFAACNTDPAQDLTSSSTPTAVPDVHMTPDPTPAVDSRLDGYTTVPILNVKYPARNTIKLWVSDPIVYVTTHEQFAQLVENSDISSTKKSELLTSYDKNYFEEKFIMLVQFFHDSGSDRVHDFVGIIIKDDKLYPVVEHGYKDFGTADSNHTIMLVELENKYTIQEPGEILTIDRYYEENSSFKSINAQ